MAVDPTLLQPRLPDQVAHGGPVIALRVEYRGRALDYRPACPLALPHRSLLPGPLHTLFARQDLQTDRSVSFYRPSGRKSSGGGGRPRRRRGGVGAEQRVGPGWGPEKPGEAGAFGKGAGGV